MGFIVVEVSHDSAGYDLFSARAFGCKVSSYCYSNLPFFGIESLVILAKS